MRTILLLLIALLLLPVTPTRGEETDEIQRLRDRERALETELERVRERIRDLEDEDRAAAEDVLWTVSLKSDAKGSGHVADVDGDGVLEVVFGTYFGDQHLTCVDGRTGAVEWRYASAGGPFDASVAIADFDGKRGLEILAADSANGRLSCLDGEGRERWTLKLPSGTDSPPAVGDLDGDGRPEVVIGTMWRRGGAGCVCVIDPRSRTIRWQADVAGCVQSEPTLVDLDGDDRLDVVVTSWRGDHGVHAFRGRDGKPLWTFVTDSDDKSPGMYHGVSVTTVDGATRLLVPTCHGDVYALDANGEALWHRHFAEYLFAPGTLADFDGDGAEELFVTGRRAYLLAVDDGRTVWETGVAAGGIARGAAAVDVTGDGRPEVVCSARTEALVLDGATGEVLHRRAVARDENDRYERISSAPLVADLDGDGTLELFVVCGRGYSGEMRAQNHGRAWALRIGEGTDAWTTFRGNLRRTGAVAR